MSNEKLDRLIKRLGGIPAVAENMELTPSTVWRWSHTYPFIPPPLAFLELIDYAREYGIPNIDMEEIARDSEACLELKSSGKRG